jgi:hypothetical protein
MRRDGVKRSRKGIDASNRVEAMNDFNPDVRKDDAILLLPDQGGLFSSAPEVVEVPLLLSTQQMFDLEEAAHQGGFTTGELVRRLVQDFIDDPRPRTRPAARKTAV